MDKGINRVTVARMEFMQPEAAGTLEIPLIQVPSPFLFRLAPSGMTTSSRRTIIKGYIPLIILKEKRFAQMILVSTRVALCKNFA
jgi:hypothetical protein